MTDEWRALRGARLFLGTPMYDGRCDAAFAFAAIRLASRCAELGVELRCWFACHEALLGRARNAVTDAFLRSGDDHLLFVDADLGFDPDDALRLLAIQRGPEGTPGHDVVAAPYPLKRLDWGQVRAAARAGFADADPDQLARVAGGVAVHPARPGPIALDRPVEVAQAGTGFMLIRRDTFVRLQATAPRPAYRSSGIGLEADASPRIVDFFAAGIDAAGDYVSEDHAFCRAVRAVGLGVWLCPWMELSHAGSHRFTTRLADLAAAGLA